MQESDLQHGATDKPEDYFQPRSWRHEEIAGATQPATWIEKDLKTGFKSYPMRSQGSQLTCTTYALAKQLSVDEIIENGQWRELSPRSIYPYVVQPGGGSHSLFATKLATKQGMTLESLLKTDGLSEIEARSDTGYVTDAKLVAQVYKPDSFIECSADFETVASILQSFEKQGKRKVITVTVAGINNGTWLSAIPVPPSPGLPAHLLWFHRISVTDFGLINGKKVLAFDNSFGEEAGNKGQQFLTEEYARATYGGIYTLNRPDDLASMSTAITPPVYEWTRDLVRGSSGPDVMALQQALQSLGMFPISTVVKPTGAFFGVTQKGVELFQSAFGLPVTGKVDLITRIQLNKIF